MKTFESNIINLYGEKGKAWLSDLPQLVDEFSAKWKLSELQVAGNLSFNYVLAGIQGSQPIILKLGLGVFTHSYIFKKTLQK